MIKLGDFEAASLYGLQCFCQLFYLVIGITFSQSSLI